MLCVGVHLSHMTASYIYMDGANAGTHPRCETDVLLGCNDDKITDTTIQHIGTGGEANGADDGQRTVQHEHGGAGGKAGPVPGH